LAGQPDDFVKLCRADTIVAIGDNPEIQQFATRFPPRRIARRRSCIVFTESLAR
jgi:hypothetical protein